MSEWNSPGREGLGLACFLSCMQPVWDAGLSPGPAAHPAVTPGATLTADPAPRAPPGTAAQLPPPPAHAEVQPQTGNK